MGVPLRGHERIDRRSLELHRAIAAKLRSHPELLQIARDNNRPLPEILSVLEEESERMTALRQATPFAGVLDPPERWAIYQRFERDRTTVP